MQIQVSLALDVLSVFDESLDLTNTPRFIVLWHLVRYELIRTFTISSPPPSVSVQAHNLAYLSIQ